MSEPSRSWYEGAFRAWLRRTAPQLSTDAREDIVRLFADRLREHGRSPAARLGILFSACADARRSGDNAAEAAPMPRRAPSGHHRFGDHVGMTARDLRFATRSLARRPAFSLIAIMTLGLGIGGSTAMFTVVDGVFLKQVPFTDPASVVNIWKAWPEWRGQDGLDYVWDKIQFPWDDYVNIRANARTFTGVAAHAQAVTVLNGEGPAEELSVGEASDNLFSLLGVTPALGRTFFEDETAPAGDPAPIVLLSHQLWDRRFGQDPQILGRTVRLNDRSFEVVGVLPADFRLGSSLIATHDLGGGVDPGLRDIWLPLGTNGTNRGNEFELIGRLAAGTTLEQARDEVQLLMILDPDDPDEQIARVEARHTVLTRDFQAPLTILLAAALLLTVIACTSVTGLLLGEVPRRRREIAVRSALGAHRSRIVRQLVTESMVLGLLGSLLGIAVAWLSTDVLLAAGPPLPNAELIGLDWRAFLFAAVVGGGTGVAFGILPAVDVSKGAAARLRSRGGERSTRQLQARVVSGQLALTVVLLVTAGLCAKSLANLFAVPPGFDPEGAHAFGIGAPVGGLASREAAARYVEDMLAAARDVPGVTAASVSSRLPFASSNGTQGFSILRGGEPQLTTQLPMVVHPSYFEILDLEAIDGRLLNDLDNDDSPRAMVVSRMWAEKYLDGESPVGLPVRFRGAEYDWTIVGVVEDVLHQALGTESEPTFYMTSLQQPRLDYMLIVRTAGDESAPVTAVRQALMRVNSGAPVRDAGPLPELVRQSEADDRFRALLLGTFAALATALAVVGVFGVTARSVSSRKRELGIRTALGARAGELKRMVVGETLGSSLIGVALGLAGAALASAAVAPLLFEVSRFDLLAFAGAAALTVLVSVGASYLPARQVARIEPAQVMAED